jgi:hypothetical protein
MNFEKMIGDHDTVFRGCLITGAAIGLLAVAGIYYLCTHTWQGKEADKKMRDEAKSGEHSRHNHR